MNDPTRPLVALRRGVVFENESAALSDIGDGIACLEHKTKMNIYDEAVFDAIGVALEEIPKGFRALVIGNDHPRAFSCGADLSFFFGRMKAGDYAAIEHFLAYGQERFLALKYAKFPVVAAAHGFALGGGCETLLHVREVVAHAELNVGLPESTLGILPGWGGCTQLMLRAKDTVDTAQGDASSLRRPFTFILSGRFCRSALQGQEAHVLRQDDPIVMNRTELIQHAKDRAIALAARYVPLVPEVMFLPGTSGKRCLIAYGEAEAGRFATNDVAVADALATVMTGGTVNPHSPLSERDVMKLEREAVLSLARRPTAFARIEHLLATGKALRN